MTPCGAEFLKLKFEAALENETGKLSALEVKTCLMVI